MLNSELIFQTPLYSLQSSSNKLPVGSQTKKPIAKKLIYNRLECFCKIMKNALSQNLSCDELQYS